MGWLKVRMEGLKCRLTVVSTQLRRGRIFAVAVGIAGRVSVFMLQINFHLWSETPDLFIC